MGTYEDIAASRRLVKIGVVAGYALAAAIVALRIVNADPRTVDEIVGSLALGAAMAMPSTLALLSLDRRPTLLPAAAIGAVAVSVVSSILLPVWLLVAFLWYRASTRRAVPLRVSRRRALARVGLGLLVLVSVLVLFAHRDPACVQYLTDGTTRSANTAERGLTSGWALSGGGTSVGSSSSTGADNVSEEICTSDTITIPESLISLTLTAAIFECGRRWPRGTSSEPVQSGLAASGT